MEPYRDIHGFMTEVPWDYAPIPERIWRNITAMPNGCWIAPSRNKGRQYSETMVERITRRSPYEAIAITPTCADLRCCNPAHLCVTWGSAVSREG